MDALTEILHSVKLEGAVFFNAEFTAPWGFRSPPSREVAAFLRKGSGHVIIYHFVLAGRARGQVEHSTRYVDLIPGDIVVFPHGDAHIFSNGTQLQSLISASSSKKCSHKECRFLEMAEGAKPRHLCAAIWNATGNYARTFCVDFHPCLS